MELPNDRGSQISRIVRGIAANGFANLVTLLSTLVVVAIFFRTWGKDLYGEWVILSAIPSYLTMSDLSFGTTAGSEMTMLVAQQKRVEALRVLQSAWLLVTFASITILLLIIVGIRFVPLASWLGLSIMSDREALSVLSLLLLGVCVAQQGGLIDACFKCSGNYAQGIFLLNLIRLSEFLAGVAVLLLKGDPWVFAWTLLVPKSIGYMACWLVLRRKVPWLHLGWSYADKSVLKPLVGPALTFNMFNLGYALSLQGMVILIGKLCSPAEVAVFGTLRTITRVVLQGANAIANTVWVELSSAMGRGDLALGRKLHRRAGQVSLWMVLPLIAVLLLAGPWLFEVLTNSAHMDYRLFVALLVSALVASVWTVSYVVPLSINKHQSTAFAFIVFAAGTLVLAGALIGPFRTYGAAMAMVVGETAMLAFVLAKSLNLLNDRLAPYLVQLLTPPVDLVLRLLGRGMKAES